MSTCVDTHFPVYFLGLSKKMRKDLYKMKKKPTKPKRKKKKKYAKILLPASHKNKQNYTLNLKALLYEYYRYGRANE